MHKILVSEDSIIVNQHICRTLEIAGYKVDAAFTGGEAIEKAAALLPDLILMDIMMESQDDGIRAAMEIKQQLDIPVIFLTALTDEGTLERVKESEPFGYIVKPFNEVELLSNIKVAIHKSRAENEVKNNRDLFQVSINSIDQAFFILDQNDEVFYLNQSAEKILNKSFKDVIGIPADKLLTIQDSEGAHQNFKKLKKATKNEELLIITKEKSMHIGDLISKEVEIKSGKFTVFLFKDISDRVNARQLEIEMEQLQMTSLIEGQENERNRLAREIHDGIGQMINLVKLNVTSLPASEEKTNLEPILEQTLSEIRNITKNLHPSRLNDFTLEKNIEQLVEQFRTNSDINFHFNSSDVPDLTHFQKTHLFRITQESISNIIKHSKAKQSTIQLIGLKHELQLTIEDDGVGYDLNVKIDGEFHHGLKNIEYRVNSMSGKLIVDSNSKSGTMLLITIPIL